MNAVERRRACRKIRRDLTTLYAPILGDRRKARARILAWAHEASTLGLENTSLFVVSMRTGIPATTLQDIRRGAGIPPFGRHSRRGIDATAEGYERAQVLRAATEASR